jgi:hypothetical protein
MKYTLLLMLLFAIGFASCRYYPSADDAIFYQDFDNLYWWGGHPVTLTDEKAHSGRFSTFADPSQNYSQTFIMDLSYAKAHAYKIMNVSGWVYVTEKPCKASFVASVESEGKTVLYQAAEVDKQVAVAGKWERLMVAFPVSEITEKNGLIKVYLWSECSKRIYLDDVTIKFIK